MLALGSAALVGLMGSRSKSSHLESSSPMSHLLPASTTTNTTSGHGLSSSGLRRRGTGRSTTTLLASIGGGGGSSLAPVEGVQRWLSSEQALAGSTSKSSLELDEELLPASGADVLMPEFGELAQAQRD